MLLLNDLIGQVAVAATLSQEAFFFKRITVLGAVDGLLLVNLVDHSGAKLSWCRLR